MMLRQAAAAIVLLGLLAAGCAPSRASRAAAQEMPSPSKMDFSELQSPGTTLSWSTSVIGGEVKDVYALGDVLCVHTVNEKLIVFDAMRGVELWRVNLPGALQFGPKRHGDILYFTINDAIYAMHPKTGDELWAKSLGIALSSPPEVYGGLIIVGTRSSMVGAWPIHGDKLAWSILQCSVTQAPVASDSTVYVPSVDGTVRAATVDKGQVKWVFRAPRPYATSPAVTSAGLAVGTSEGTIYWLTPEGEKLWERVLSRPVSRVLASDKLLVPMSYPDGATLVDSATGSEIGKVALAQRLAGVTEKAVCFKAGKELVAVSRDDAQPVWRLPLKEPIMAAENPSTADVYLATKSGALAAVKLK